MRAFRLKRTNSATAAVNGWTMMLHRASQCSRSYFKMTEASYLLSPSPQTPQQRVTQAAATPWIPRQSWASTATASSAVQGSPAPLPVGSSAPTPSTISASIWQPPPTPSSALTTQNSPTTLYLDMPSATSTSPAFGIPGGVFPSLYSQSTNPSRRVSMQRGLRQKPYASAMSPPSQSTSLFGNASINMQYSLCFLPYSVSSGMINDD